MIIFLPCSLLLSHEELHTLKFSFDHEEVTALEDTGAQGWTYSVSLLSINFFYRKISVMGFGKGVDQRRAFSDNFSYFWLGRGMKDFASNEFDEDKQ